MEKVKENELSTVLAKVFSIMGLGLLITASTSAVAFNTAVFNSALFYGAIVLEFILVIAISLMPNTKESTGLAFVLFCIYSGLNGFTITPLVQYAGLGNATQAFAVTTVTFLIMATYGIITKKDLTGWGSILFMALIGIILATVANIFIFQSGMIDLILSCITIVVFVGLTAYDTQSIKVDCLEGNLSNPVVYALELYLDFINLFVHILRIFAGSDDD